MRRLSILLSVFLLTCPALPLAAQDQTPAQKPAAPQEQPKNEVELALEEAKKRGEPILAACLEDCGEGDADVLKGQALELPQPAYPAIARAARVSGVVHVQVIIDTDGKVVAAAVLDGHPLLRSACLIAARNSRFSPTLYEGKPVKVVGVVKYNFVSR